MQRLAERKMSRYSYCPTKNRNRVNNFCQIVVIAMCAVWINMMSFSKGDDCRNIQFIQPVENMALENHVIRSDRVTNEDICQLNCYREPNCVSYNYGPQGDGTFLCELSDSNHQRESSSDLRVRDGFIYSTIMNTCLRSPCTSNNATCQVGFGDKGYRCVCPQGYHGDECDVVLFQCPPSWIAFEGSCYKLFTDEKDWNEAKSFCNANGAQLVKIESDDENTFITEEFLADNVDYWIGLTDAETENVWKWSDGSPLTGYTSWMSGQPNDYNGQDCGGIRKGTFFKKDYDGDWHDDTCSAAKEKGFICEM